jgi:hypothetical protein
MLYSGQRSVVATAVSSRLYERLVFGIWSQQWPMLREHFRFSTGSFAQHRNVGHAGQPALFSGQVEGLFQRARFAIHGGASFFCIEALFDKPLDVGRRYVNRSSERKERPERLQVRFEPIHGFRAFVLQVRFKRIQEGANGHSLFTLSNERPTVNLLQAGLQEPARRGFVSRLRALAPFATVGVIGER